MIMNLTSFEPQRSKSSEWLNKLHSIKSTCVVSHQCYSVLIESDPSACNQLETCENSIRSCETKVKIKDGEVVSISKGCKPQDECVKSQHNPVNYWTPSSCSTEGGVSTTNRKLYFASIFDIYRVWRGVPGQFDFDFGWQNHLTKLKSW